MASFCSESHLFLKALEGRARSPNPNLGGVFWRLICELPFRITLVFEDIFVSSVFEGIFAVIVALSIQLPPILFVSCGPTVRTVVLLREKAWPSRLFFRSAAEMRLPERKKDTVF